MLFFQEMIYFTLEGKKVEFIVVYREYERCCWSILRGEKIIFYCNYLLLYYVDLEWIHAICHISFLWFFFINLADI